MEQLLQKIVHSAPSAKPFIVGVNGIDASGKSHFAEALAADLVSAGKNVQLVHVDDFHLPRSQRAKCSMTPPECYYQHTFDWDRLEQEVLTPITTEQRLDRELTVLNLVTDSYDTTRHYFVTRDTVVLVEGVFLFTPRLAHNFDLKVFLSIEEAECLRRVIMRDGYLFGTSNIIEARYREKYLPGQRLYINECNPQLNSDLVIDNNDPARPIWHWQG